MAVHGLLLSLLLLARFIRLWRSNGRMASALHARHSRTHREFSTILLVILFFHCMCVCCVRFATLFWISYREKRITTNDEHAYINHYPYYLAVCTALMQYCYYYCFSYVLPLGCCFVYSMKSTVYTHYWKRNHSEWRVHANEIIIDVKALKRIKREKNTRKKQRTGSCAGDAFYAFPEKILFVLLSLSQENEKRFKWILVIPAEYQKDFLFWKISIFIRFRRFSESQLQNMIWSSNKNKPRRKKWEQNTQTHDEKFDSNKSHIIHIRSKFIKNISRVKRLVWRICRFRRQLYHLFLIEWETNRKQRVKSFVSQFIALPRNNLHKRWIGFYSFC